MSLFLLFNTRPTERCRLICLATRNRKRIVFSRIAVDLGRAFPHFCPEGTRGLASVWWGLASLLYVRCLPCYTFKLKVTLANLAVWWLICVQGRTITISHLAHVHKWDYLAEEIYSLPGSSTRLTMPMRFSGRFVEQLPLLVLLDVSWVLFFRFIMIREIIFEEFEVK